MLLKRAENGQERLVTLRLSRGIKGVFLFTAVGQTFFFFSFLMPVDSEQKYFTSFNDAIVASTIGGFVSFVEPYSVDEDELREMNDR